jgi:TatD DNase family protein
MLGELVDFHCHLDLYPNLESAAAECEREGVYTLAVTTTPRAWPRNKEVAQKTRHVRAALGLHPQLIAERADEIDLWEKYLVQTRYVGEVGLDAGPRFYHSMQRQQQVFERVLRACARQGDKILSVHSVRAAGAVIELIQAYLPADRGRVVLHWFTGSKAEARRALDLGCYFSINSQMLHNDRQCALLATLPADRLLTETDGPFTHLGHRPTRPTDVITVVEGLARTRGASAIAIASTIRENLRTLLADPPV